MLYAVGDTTRGSHLLENIRAEQTGEKFAYSDNGRGKKSRK